MGSRPIQCYFLCTVNLFSLELIYREVIKKTQLQSREIINILILYVKKKERISYMLHEKHDLSFYGNIKEHMV